MNVAIVYDRVNKWGGAERVLLTLHEMFPKAPLFASVYSSQKAQWARNFLRVNASFLNKIKFLRDKHEYLPILMPIAFESFNFDEFDLVISVTSEAAKGIITKPQTLHICYCLTPTRYLWSHYHLYFSNLFLRLMLKPFIFYLRYWDKIAAQRPDVVVGISNSSCERIRKYYAREPEIIFPPVDIDKFNYKKSKSLLFIPKFRSLKEKGYFLLVSRLVMYKRVDIAIDAFNELGLPLVVVGKGIMEAKLRQRAKENIVFFKDLKDEELFYLYKNAKALIFPGEEDFGLVMAEAQASGTPVIAYRAGGALDIVINGKTGLFFNEQNPKSLKEAVFFSEKRYFSPEECLKNAKRFSKENFKIKFYELIEKYLDRKKR